MNIPIADKPVDNSLFLFSPPTNEPARPFSSASCAIWSSIGSPNRSRPRSSTKESLTDHRQASYLWFRIAALSMLSHKNPQSDMKRSRDENKRKPSSSKPRQLRSPQRLLLLKRSNFEIWPIPEPNHSFSVHVALTHVALTHGGQNKKFEMDTVECLEWPTYCPILLWTLAQRAQLQQ